MTGTLFLVSTPIGNLEDISFRAKRILSEVEILLAEDTRRTAKLLSFLEIGKKKIIPFYKEVEREASFKALDFLKQGRNVALVSDAGTPLVSDPGSFLVKEALLEGIKVFSIPGPSALLTAILVSGLPTDKFFFGGFLPKSEKKKRKFFEKIFKAGKEIGFTVIFYESPLRLFKTLSLIRNIWGDDIDFALCIELTKKFERVIRGKLSQLLSEWDHSDKIKGEVTIVFRLKGEKKTF